MDDPGFDPVATTAPAPRAQQDGARFQIVPPHAGTWLGVVAASALFVIVAVVLEVIGGSYANSPLPAWAEIVPIAWPQAARVAWWSGVAVAAGLFRLGLHRLGIRQRPVVVLASVLPFVAFAAGIASGAGWSTWH